MALLISTIVCIMNIYQYFNETDSSKLKLMKSLKATKKQLYFKLILPSNKSNLISTLKINISMTLIGVIMGEFLTSKAGIGYLIMYGSQVFNLNIVITGVIILGIIAVIMSFIINPCAKVIFTIIKLLVDILILISKISQLPFAKLYIPTPKIWQICLFYCIIIISKLVHNLYYQKKLNATQIRMRNLIALFKYKMYLNKKRSLMALVLLGVIILLVEFYPKNLKVNFIDVGQGDATFIVTPYNNTILIDGGGSESKNYNIGKNTVLPYILDKGYTKIDYIIISHFDQDHVRWIVIYYARNKSK